MRRWLALVLNAVALLLVLQMEGLRCESDTDAACPRQCSSSTTLRPFVLAEDSVVDVFFVISGLKSYEFVGHGQFWVALEALQLLSRRANGKFDARLHVLSENSDILAKVASMGEPFHSHDMKTMESISKPFWDVYQRVHDSVNSLEYEYLCFNRWHLMRHIMASSSVRMTRILSLDLDVLMLVSANELVSRVMYALEYDSEKDFDVIVIGLGAINLFSPSGLESFSEYIHKYFGREVDVVAKAVSSYGHYFSDMMIMKEYLLDKQASQPLRKNACFELWRAKDYYTHWRAQASNRCLLERLQCVPMSGYREMVTSDNQLVYNRTGLLSAAAVAAGEGEGDRTFQKPQFPLLYGSREALPYCLIHFQGKQVKSHLMIVGNLLKQLLLESSPHPSDASQSPSSLLVHIKNSREIVLLEGAYRRAIPSYEAMVKRNLTSRPILQGIPHKLVQLYKEGEPLE